MYDFAKCPLKVIQKSTWLEYYAFEKYGPGAYKLFVQVGWNAGSNNDGNGNRYDIPSEWLAMTWADFLEKLEARFPANEFGFSGVELLENQELKKFLGF